MLGFRGSTEEKFGFEILRFGYGKGANDKKVPDRVGSGLCSANRALCLGDHKHEIRHQGAVRRRELRLF
jgi:hypothetical protein